MQHFLFLSFYPFTFPFTFLPIQHKFCTSLHFKKLPAIKITVLHDTAKGVFSAGPGGIV